MEIGTDGNKPQATGKTQVGAVAKGERMRIFIMILLAVIIVLMIFGYALLVVAHEADERADRMYRKWKEERDERSR